MESPVASKEMDYWETKGSAIFTKNNIVLVPEVSDAKGAILNKMMVPYKDDWIVDVKTTIGNDVESPKGGAGLGFYYLKEINQDELGNGIFGYSRNFNGFSVFLNSLVQVQDDDG